MATLLDAIRQNSTPAKAGAEDNTDKAQGLLRTKLGKAGAAPDSANVNLTEAGSVDQTNSQLGQVGTQANLMAQGAQQNQEAQTQATTQAKSDIAQGVRFNNIQNQLKTNELLQSAEQDRGRLDLSKDKAKAEQIASNLRLQNKQYIDQLQRAGNVDRLDNAASFKQKYYETMFNNKAELAAIGRSNKAVYNMNDREFSKALGDMDINYARTLFDTQIAADKQRQTYSQVGTAVQSGIGAYGTYADSQDKKDYYTTGAGANDTSYEASKARK